MTGMILLSCKEGIKNMPVKGIKKLGFQAMTEEMELGIINLTQMKGYARLL